jgi:hypothetical protein
MVRDFTIERFEQLLRSLLKAGYKILSFRDYLSLQQRPDRFVVLRHDVDSKPLKALQLAELESRFNIAGTYYFRSTKDVFNTDVIHRIYQLGHEVGYHYEELSRHQGNFELSIASFTQSLEAFREVCPVDTICMHGSPLSAIDNRLLWAKYDYRDFGIKGEIYLDTDFSKLFYLTDTGRSWNSKYNIRDKVDSPFKIRILDTPHLMRLLFEQEFPPQLMITVHPERWASSRTAWAAEALTQPVKNLCKYLLIKKRTIDVGIR